MRSRFVRRTICALLVAGRGSFLEGALPTRADSLEGASGPASVAAPKFVLAHTLIGHDRFVYALALSPDGRWLASGGSAPTVQMWDATTGAKIGALESHTAAVEAVVLSRDGRWLASGSDDDTAKLWRSND